MSTGSHDITVPTSGVFLNMITKTGGNKWAGSTTVTWTGDKPPGPQRHGSDAAEIRVPAQQQHVGLRLGHQLRRRRAAGAEQAARFYGSFRDWRVHHNVPVQLSQVVLDQTNITSGLANVTWQVNQNNRINGFYSRQRYSKPNRLLNNASVTVI